ncbi:MarR family winged helix-turn-helix transcriptional regulator [Pseudonocardia kunmingensis]|uniref:DNA-binding MarR family transcriptional regulator n=1 Tax=Pseudonocardia kunmingensis TaxID=630975 RepID=A0A543D3C3_9PSEU|nr:MarR family transcriptional regulator [Pseudonocardia kunmingensis]TQM03833.1 DNA-binding MarR family transcriptional regulator [Pseudonocardia kunmingensis]
MAGEPVDQVDAITAAWARERPNMPTDGIALVSRTWRLAKLFGEQRRRVLAEAGADQATLDLLSVLRRAGAPYELAPGEIARRSMVTAGAISQRLTRAERDGLVERTREPGSRYATVRLLPTGHELVDRLVGRIADLDTDLVAGLTPAQRGEFDDLLRVLIDDLERRYGPAVMTQVGSEREEPPSR